MFKCATLYLLVFSSVESGRWRRLTGQCRCENASYVTTAGQNKECASGLVLSAKGRARATLSTQGGCRASTSIYLLCLPITVPSLTLLNYVFK